MPPASPIEVLKAENEKLKETIKSLDMSAQMLISCDIELRDANDRLSTLDTQKSEFVAIAAHQLRTPLTSIRFANQMLNDSISEKLTPDQLKVLVSARISIDRMFDMIEDLLVVDSIDYGNLKLTFESVVVEQCIEEILFGFTEEIKNKSLHVQKNFTEQASKVLCDVRKIKDALSNIIDNAIKYTPQKGTISISTACSDSHVTITISDTGIGIEKNDVDLLFRKFSRMDNAKLLDANGSGLGLYIAKKIIEKHKGTIAFSDHLPTGTSFIISLPL